LESHLGTPIAKFKSSTFDWRGGFEPFGADWNGAQAAGVFLRFPGQWLDEAWKDASLGAEVYYNVHRWYEHGVGRYGRVDPLGLDGGHENVYLYARSSPVEGLDPLGLQLEVPPKDWYEPAPNDSIPPTCTGGPWSFEGYLTWFKGNLRSWQLVRSTPVRIPRFGPPAERGTGSATLGCICEYALKMYRVYDKYSRWKQVVTCSPCEKYERWRTRKEQEIRFDQPYIASNFPKRLEWAPLCALCPRRLENWQ
jgi:RHS repeat-associated protein